MAKQSTKKITAISVTAKQELPDQYVMDFFNQGIPITQAPKDVVMKKSNAAIKMVNTLGLLELKIIDACVFVAKARMNENILHSADLEYFKWLLSYNSQNRDHLKKAFTKIQQTLIQINIVDEARPDKDFWHSTNFLYDVSITNGRVYFRVPESIRQPLVNPQSWTYLSFRIKNMFTSEYAYRLYERCRAEQYRGATDWCPLDEFRAIMNVADSYPQFNDLNKRVIKPAIEQINTCSDIYITPDYQTRGRTKTHVRFIITENPNVSKTVSEIEKVPMEIYDALKKEFGFSNSQIDSITDYPIDYLAQKIDFTRHRIKTSKAKIGRPDLYLIKALEEDLQFNTSEIAIFESQKKAHLTLVTANEKKVKEREAQQKTTDLWDRFVALDEDRQAEIVDAFKASEHFAQIKGFVPKAKFSIDNKLVRGALQQYLKDNDKV